MNRYCFAVFLFFIFLNLFAENSSSRIEPVLPTVGTYIDHNTGGSLIGQVLPTVGIYIDHKIGDKSYIINLRINSSSDNNRVNRFELYFLDQDKKVVAPPYNSAIVRFRAQDDIDQTLYSDSLNMFQKSFLKGERVVTQYNYFVFIVLKTPTGEITLPGSAMHK